MIVFCTSASRRRIILILAIVLPCFLTSCSGSKMSAPASHENSGSQDVGQILSKYSDLELREILSDRRNKSLHDNSPSDVRRVSDAQIVDYMIYRQKTLYGTDRRKEFYEVTDPIELQVVNSVAAIVKEGHYEELSTVFHLTGKTLGIDNDLCSGEHYFSQPVVASCTGFVVGPDLIATAGHCIPPDLTSIRIVFGYRAIRPENDIRVITEVPKSQVYKALEVTSKRYDGKDTREIDYAIMRVDRKINDHLPLPLDTAAGVKTGDELYTLGFPSGLPVKLADQAFVRSVSDKGYFVSNLDTFSGNSAIAGIEGRFSHRGRHFGSRG